MTTLGTNRSKRVGDVPRRDGYYRLRMDGEDVKFASVTTILGVINKPALVTWAAKTAASLVLEDPYTYSTAEAAASGIYKQRDAAGDRGSTIHSAVEALLYGAPIDVDAIPEDFRGYVQGFAKFVADRRPSPHRIEVACYNTTHRYAGTCDFLGNLDGSDDLWLLDWKTGRYIYDEAGLQARAYRECDLMLPRYVPCSACIGGDPTCETCWGQPHGVKNTDLMPMPNVSRVGIVLLRPNGTYVMEEPDDPFDAFLAAKTLWEWRRSK